MSIQSRRHHSLIVAIFAAASNAWGAQIIDDFSDGAASWTTGPGWSTVQTTPGAYAFRVDYVGDTLTRKSNVSLDNSWRLDVDVRFLSHYASSSTRGVASFGLYPSSGSPILLVALVDHLTNGGARFEIAWWDAASRVWQTVLNTGSFLSTGTNSYHMQLTRLEGSDRLNFAVTAGNGFSYRSDTAAIPFFLLDSLRGPGLHADEVKADFSTFSITTPFVPTPPPIITTQPQDQIIPAGATDPQVAPDYTTSTTEEVQR